MDANSLAPVVDGCCAGCGQDPAHSEAELAISCSLGTSDFKGRVESIRELARKSLLRSHREPLALHLTYAQDALAAVHDLVAKEMECCAFLDFKVRDTAEAVEVTITAPVAALSAADELFAHFAPELARNAA